MNIQIYPRLIITLIILACGAWSPVKSVAQSLTADEIERDILHTLDDKFAWGEYDHILNRDHEALRKAFIDLLETRASRHPGVVRIVVQLLGKLPPARETTDILLDVAADKDAEYGARNYANRILGEVGEPRVLPRLWEIYVADFEHLKQSRGVASSALYAFEKFGELGAPYLRRAAEEARKLAEAQTGKDQGRRLS